MRKVGIYEKYFKRLFDLLFSILALTLLTPLMLFTALLIRIKLGSPIIFKQARPGLHEKMFVLYKFRTMTDEKDLNGNFLPDSNRLTKFGKTLRSLSIDELPSLVNIIKGDMSVVGPRPLLEEYLIIYNEEQRKRHNVKPGLTGFAQTNGRNDLTWEKRFDFDIKYIHNITFKNDILIILKTILKVLRREGISSKNSVTMEKFELKSNRSNHYK